jgi:DNA repair exonuclease SbcCD ATPase subunit
MILYLHPYAPHRDTRIETADAGLYVVSGLNGSGKSTLVEAYAAACWGRSLRGASAWRSEDCRIDLALPGLTVERTPNTLHVNGEAALTPAKTQQRLASIVGDFATWQRTRVFDADLTARFGASGDGERKKLLEQLLGLEKLDAGLRRCREDIREAERLCAAAERSQSIADAGLAEQPVHVAFDAQALARCTELLREAEQRAAEMAKEAGRLQQEKTAADRAIELFHSGHCPTCAQVVSTERWLLVRDAASQALSAQTQAQRAAVQDVAPLLAQVRELRAVQATAERAAQAEDRRAELTARRTEAAAQRAVHETTLRRLRAVEAFIVQARPRLLSSSLAILQEAASAWLPGLSIGEDMVVRHGQRTYKELNEGHRRLCDMAVLLGLSDMGDAKVKGPIFLDGALHGLDEDRQDAVVSLLETVAQRELVIVFTCVEETALRFRGARFRVVDGTARKG